MSSTPAVLVHMCAAREWSSARRRGGFRPGSATAFIHLSTPEQIHLPANRLFHGRRDMVLLYIDPAALDSPVRWEPGTLADPDWMLFPHLYGPLPLRAVIRVCGYPPAPDGTFPPIPGRQASR
ncbi:DUF952 domain-containing protein [Mycobacterium gastri]|uniref:Glutathione S-transferase n=1 Tax=Mycobacterium gastri TaxID=1777 RepID=A0A1X1VHN9_MYCGS|nr:DUF952 domain-containing protein [Mycobacterium gastri]ETW25399.1 glutathione S-transferase [Mycobacterium gastri 'Wayne']ORV68556.1 glutathione S-transferase [Mycobacterium gastri]